MKKKKARTGELGKLDQKFDRWSLTTAIAGCVFFLCAIGFLAGAIGCTMWRENRTFILNCCDREMVARLGNGLLKETLDYNESEAAKGNDPYFLAYTLDDDDNTVLSIRRSELTPTTISDKKTKFTSEIKGSDIPRRHDTTDDGEPYVAYKLPYNLSYTFETGFTVYYDWVVKVADPDLNARIDETYRNIKLYGRVAILSITFGFFVAVPILLAASVAMSKIEKEINLAEQKLSADLKKKAANDLVATYDQIVKVIDKFETIVTEQIEGVTDTRMTNDRIAELIESLKNEMDITKIGGKHGYAKKPE